MNILDVGSRVVIADAGSYKTSINPLGMNYVGLDLEAGENVQIVPRNPYIWDEIENDSFNFAVSGQTFEHNPFMWITICEIARILKEGGVALIIAPSAGPVHRWPYDCWRYYPDSWAALATLAGLDLAETIREPEDRHKVVPGGKWMDAAAVFRKPVFGDNQARQNFYKNLAEITAPLRRDGMRWCLPRLMKDHAFSTI